MCPFLWVAVISECLTLCGESLRKEGIVDSIFRETFPCLSFHLQSLFHKNFLFSGKFGGKNLKTLQQKQLGFCRGRKKNKTQTRQGEEWGVTAPIIEGLIWDSSFSLFAAAAELAIMLSGDVTYRDQFHKVFHSLGSLEQCYSKYLCWFPKLDLLHWNHRKNVIWFMKGVSQPFT